MSEISNQIFNTSKTDYENPSLFLSEGGNGLFDTVNKQYPEIWKIYKTVKSLDWDEDEFDYSSCVKDFKTCDKSTYDMMIKTLAWQWEADSIASRISPVAGNIVTSPELWAAWQRVSDQECFVEGTEVLTPNGWLDLSEVTTETLVAQYDVDGSVEFVKPSRIIEKDYDGEVYKFSTDNRHVQQTVTPKHRMYFRQNKGMRGIIAHAEKDNIFYGSQSSGLSFVVAGKTTGVREELTPYERFVIATQLDGCISERCTGERCGTIPVWVSFSKERKIERFLWLCEEVGFDCVELTGEPEKGNRKARRRFKVNVPVELATNLKSFDGFDLTDKSYLWCRDFLEEVTMWGGYDTKKNVKLLDCCNRSVVEFCQAVAACAGYKTHFAEIEDNRSETFNNTYKVSWKDQDYHGLQNAKREVEHYSGKVRCVTVDSGLILVRYKGSVSVSGNCLHAATYSEIVRNSFDDPSDIINEILSVSQSIERVTEVGKALSEVAKASNEYALGLRPNDQEMYNHCFMFPVAMLGLERIQFMASFAVTFGICDTGSFQPIGKAVQKIAQDEFETHVALDKAVIKHELTTTRGKIAYETLKPRIQKLIDDIVEQEMEWIDYLFSEGRELLGLNADLLKKWTLFCARDVYEFLDLKSPRPLPRQNPLRFMEKWLNIGKTQPAPQEEQIGQYKVGIMVRDDETQKFDYDF